MCISSEYQAISVYLFALYIFKKASPKDALANTYCSEFKLISNMMLL